LAEVNYIPIGLQEFFMRSIALFVIVASIFSGCLWKEFLLTEVSTAPSAFVNYALKSNGAEVRVFQENYDHPSSTLINGVTNPDLWDQGEGWEQSYEINYEFFFEDGQVSAAKPAVVSLGWAIVDLPQPKELNRIIIHTLDSRKYPGMTYSVRKLIVQYMPNDHGLSQAGWFGIERTDRALGQPMNGVRGNTDGVIDIRFKPVVTRSIRITIQSTNDLKRQRATSYVGNIRLIEIELYGTERISETEEDLF
jgi:hypothetical protein